MKRVLSVILAAFLLAVALPAHAQSIGTNAEIGQIGDSLTTGNEGSLGAVRIYLPFYTSLRTPFINGAGRNLGAPTWHIFAVDGQNCQTVRTYEANLPTNITHLIVECGTNDLTNSVAQATTVAQVTGAMTDAVSRFPDLRQVIILGPTCIGEMYVVNSGTASFSGNTPVTDSTTDALVVALQGAVASQTGTNSHGVPITFSYAITRAPAAAALQANPSTPAPWQNAGFLTVDGRHPMAGGLDVVAKNGTTAVLIP